MRTIYLEDLKPGQTGVIHEMQTTSQTPLLMEMGLTVGTEIKFIKKAPLGDPLELRVRGYYLSVRKADTQGVLVKLTDQKNPT